ncbi:MAG: hypothetical protein WC003_01715 [Terrimicrobiaceae bacterium]
MHRLPPLALTLSVILGFAALGRAGNIVSNPSFEEAGTDGAPPGWKFHFPAVPDKNPLSLVRGDPSLYSVDEAAAKEGGHSLRISSVEPVRCSLSQNLTLKPGQTLRLSAWMKGENLGDGGESQGACVRLGFINKSNPDIQQQLGAKNVYLRSVESTFDWAFFTVDVTVPEGTEVVALECYLWQAKGTIWFDQVSVEVLGGKNRGSPND